MNTRSIFQTMVAGTISLGLYATCAHADADYSPAQVRELFDKGEILALSEIQSMHSERLAGRILDVELERKRGTLIYEFEVFGKDGVVREIYINAADGRVLKEEIED